MTKPTDPLAPLIRRFDLDAERAALIVIDLQYASASRHHGFGKWLTAQGRAQEGEYRFSRIEELVVPKVRLLLRAFRSAGIPVIFVRTGALTADYSDLAPHRREMQQALGNLVGTPVHAFLEEVAPLTGELVLTKTSTSAFTTTSIDFVLRNLTRSQLVFAGVSTSQCVDLTARDAADRGFQCAIVEDAVAEDTEEFHETSLRLFERLFGLVLTTEEVVRAVSATAPRDDVDRLGREHTMKHH